MGKSESAQGGQIGWKIYLSQVAAAIKRTAVNLGQTFRQLNLGEVGAAIECFPGNERQALPQFDGFKPHTPIKGAEANGLHPAGNRNTR